MAETVAITGANRGIGHALASAYAARGDKVVGTYRTTAPPPLAGTHWVQADVSAPRSLQEVRAAVGEKGLDLLICNAGVYLDRGHSLPDGFEPELWAESFATNVTGVFETVRAFLPELQAAAPSRIAVIASNMGNASRSAGGSYIYRASKAAVINLARNLATDLAPAGIAVGAYHPGWVRTDMGGTGAALDVETSVTGLIRAFDALSTKQAGQFLNYDGENLLM